MIRRPRSLHSLEPVAAVACRISCSRGNSANSSQLTGNGEDRGARVSGIVEINKQMTWGHGTPTPAYHGCCSRTANNNSRNSNKT